VRRIQVFGRGWRPGGGSFPNIGVIAEEETWRHLDRPINPDTTRMHHIAATIPFPSCESGRFPPTVLGELIQCAYEVEAVVSPATTSGHAAAGVQL